ncbi:MULTISPECIES: CPBP family intramembrane glutamic endopeptidase [Prochlorococcus]|uniref:CPBP family intramembrane glutamic endopeptidase n=1 Tax=Prochlorococcus TaxID=1218 RepID=UPI00069097AF|nr:MULTISPECIES: type II CAAX endopeptidase family protein [Prochlorococcus]
MNYFLQRWLKQRLFWLPTIVLLPFLYLLGWIIVQPLGFIAKDLEKDDVALIGTIITFICFLLILPIWVKTRWKVEKPWLEFGFSKIDINLFFTTLTKGMTWSLMLILVILTTIFVGGWGNWQGNFNLGVLINAISLGIGVGLAEELIFRGWLWGEMNLIFGSKWGLFIQAVIFSIAHIPFNLGAIPVIFLSIGLFLLGIVLSIRRTLDRGSLIGCIGFHGGLVGIWFLLNNGLIRLDKDYPSLLLGPGNSTPNPIGGGIAIIAFLGIICCYRTAVAIAREPSSGARNASSRGAIP